MRRRAAGILAILMSAGLCVSGCGSTPSGSTATAETQSAAETTAEESAVDQSAADDKAEDMEREAEISDNGSTEAASAAASVQVDTDPTTDEERAAIEEALNLANNEEVTWTYDSSSDAWVMSIVTAVTKPEIEDEQGVSVCVPGAYVTGIDTDGDGTEDVTASDADGDIAGNLVIDHEASVTSTNGQVYTADTAPVIINTGAAGYGNSSNTKAGTNYAAEGYINVACGNRGKQDTATDSDGNTYYTGDAPSCLVDQKNAARFVKYNILAGNLPGSVDYFVSTGGSGGGAHATMFAATSNNSDFYDYEIEAGAVGVYRNEDGSYSTTVTIDGTDYEISDGAWGCIAYSAITSLAEGDMAMAFEYNLDTDYEFGTEFQKQLASYLSAEYMDYINEKGLKGDESKLGFDLNNDGDTEDTVDLTIEYDEEKYADTNGYGGTYLDLYLAEFTSNLDWYLNSLDYAEGWTWFDADGNALSDEEVASMTTVDKATAFVEGRYAKSSSGGGMGGPGEGGGRANGGGPGNGGGAPDGAPGGGGPRGSGEPGASSEGSTGGETAAAAGTDGAPSDAAGGAEMAAADAQGESASSGSTSGDEMKVGTPDQGTTQASGSSTNSNNYSSYDEMLAAYEEDIASVEAGDRYGKNQVELYNPLNYIGAEGTEDPTWTRILMGASEGDMSMFASLNLQLAFLDAGVDAEIAWQWDGGHVPSEILGDSLALYVDQMYAEHVADAATTTIEKAAAEAQTENGTDEEASGTDLTSWVTLTDNGDGTVSTSFSLADAASYRTAGASKAVPGFDVIDYGQEDYVFGDSTQDARHWNSHLLKVFQEQKDTLSSLFSAE